MDSFSFMFENSAFMALLFAVCISTAYSLSTGAPVAACETLSPSRGGHSALAQTTAVPYEIDTSVFSDPNTGGSELSYEPSTPYQSELAVVAEQHAVKYSSHNDCM